MSTLDQTPESFDVDVRILGEVLSAPAVMLPDVLEVHAQTEETALDVRTETYDPAGALLYAGEVVEQPFTVELQAWNLDPENPTGTGLRFRGAVPNLLADGMTAAGAATRCAIVDASGAQLPVFTVAAGGALGPAWHPLAPVDLATGRFAGTDEDRPVQSTIVEVTVPGDVPIGTYRPLTFVGRTTRTAATLAEQGHRWAKNGVYLARATTPGRVRLMARCWHWPVWAGAPIVLEPQDLPLATQSGQTLTGAAGTGTTFTYYVWWDRATEALVVTAGLSAVNEQYYLLASFSLHAAAGKTFTWGTSTFDDEGITVTFGTASADYPTGANFTVQTPAAPAALLCLAPSEAARACASGILGVGPTAPLPKAETDTWPELADAESSQDRWYTYQSNRSSGFRAGLGMGASSQYEPGCVWTMRYARQPHARWLVYASTATWSHAQTYTLVRKGLNEEIELATAQHAQLYLLGGNPEELTWLQWQAIGSGRRFLQDGNNAKRTPSLTGARPNGRVLLASALALRCRVPYPTTWYTYSDRTNQVPTTTWHSGWEDMIDHNLTLIEAFKESSGRFAESPWPAAVNDRNEPQTTTPAKPMMTGVAHMGLTEVVEGAHPNRGAAWAGHDFAGRAWAVVQPTLHWVLDTAWDGPASWKQPPVAKAYTDPVGFVYTVETFYYLPAHYFGAAPTHRWDPAAPHPKGGLGAFVTTGGTLTHNQGEGVSGWDAAGGVAQNGGPMFPGLALAMGREPDAGKRARVAEVLEHATRRARMHKYAPTDPQWGLVGWNGYVDYFVTKFGNEAWCGWGRGLVALRDYFGR